MKKENGKIYYEVDDILYYPHPDTNNKEYIIEKLTVASIGNGIIHFKDPKYYQKRVGEVYSPYTQLFLSKEEALAYIKTNPFNF